MMGYLCSDFESISVRDWNNLLFLVFIVSIKKLMIYGHVSLRLDQKWLKQVRLFFLTLENSFENVYYHRDNDQPTG